MKTMSVSDARANLPEIIDRVNRASGDAVGIVRHGHPVAAIISADLYGAIIETLEILADEGTARILRQALKEAGRSKFIPFDQVRRDLGI